MQEIAEALKKQREAKGFSIDDLFQRTRINPDFLRALDTGNFDILPDTYVRLFIKKYAQEVGLNVEDILAQYDKLAPPKAAPTPTPPPVHRKQNYQPIIFAAIGIAIVAVLIWQIGQHSEQDIAAPLDATLSVPPTPQTTAPAPTQETSLQTESIEQSQETSSQTESTEQPTPAPSLAEQIPTSQTPAVPEIEEAESVVTTNTPPPLETPSPNEPSSVADLSPISDVPAPDPPSQANMQEALSLEETTADMQTETTPETPTEQTPTSDIATMTPNQPETPLTTSDPPAETPQNEPNTMPLPVVIAPEYPILLSGIAQETTQLVVKVDGRVLFDGILQAGSRPRWTARNSLELTLSNRNALSLSLQNQPLQFDAATNPAIQLNIDRNQIRILPLNQ